MDGSHPQNDAVPMIDATAATVFSNDSSSEPAITAAEIFGAQEQWAAGIVEIGSLFLAGGDYVSHTHSLIDTLYGYAEGDVLFKPTLATKQPFRPTQVEAISYFIGGVVNEDLGFALRPWQHVRFGEQHVILQGRTALSMGHYYFTEYNLPSDVKAVFTFGYFGNADCAVKINLQHSSFPYTLSK